MHHSCCHSNSLVINKKNIIGGNDMDIILHTVIHVPACITKGAT